MRANRSDGRLRVLHMVQNLNYGGMERLMFEMLRYSDPARFENFVLNLQYVGRFGERLDEFANVSVASPMSRLSLLYPRMLARDIRKIAPDVVHTHSGVWFKATRAARMAGVPWLVHTEHGRALPDPLPARVLDHLAANRTDAIVAVSETVAALLKQNVTRRWNAIHVIPNGVDTDVFCPVPDDGRLRTELRLSATAPIIGSIGRLEPIKGYEVMVDAYAALCESWSDGERPALVIAGDGSERVHLEQRARARGVAGGIHWLGWRDDIVHLHAALSLFTMSSHSEGTSVSLLEAMSAGICPVVTDVGGNRAVLGASLAHRLSPPGDAPALASLWAEGLRNGGARRADAMRARKRIETSFTLAAMVRAYERLYARDTIAVSS